MKFEGHEIELSARENVCGRSPTAPTPKLRRIVQLRLCSAAGTAHAHGDGLDVEPCPRTGRILARDLPGELQRLDDDSRHRTYPDLDRLHGPSFPGPLEGFRRKLDQTRRDRELMHRCAGRRAPAHGRMPSSVSSLLWSFPAPLPDVASDSSYGLRIRRESSPCPGSLRGGVKLPGTRRCRRATGRHGENETRVPEAPRRPVGYGFPGRPPPSEICLLHRWTSGKGLTQTSNRPNSSDAYASKRPSGNRGMACPACILLPCPSSLRRRLRPCPLS